MADPQLPFEVDWYTTSDPLRFECRNVTSKESETGPPVVKTVRYIPEDENDASFVPD